MLSPDLTPEAFHYSHQINYLQIYSAALVEAVLLHGHFRGKEGVDEGDKAFIRNSWSLCFVWGPNMRLNTLGFNEAKIEVEKGCLCGAGV